MAGDHLGDQGDAKTVATSSSRVGRSLTSRVVWRSRPAAASCWSTSMRSPQSGWKSTNGSPASSARPTWSRPASGWLGAQATSSGLLASLRTTSPLGGRPTGATRARSRAPAATSASRVPVPAWRSRSSTPGCSAWKRPSTASRSTAGGRICIVPTARLPRRSPCTAATASAAADAAARARRASGSRASPAWVSSTRRVLRTNRAAPSSRSRARIDADSPDWTMCSRWAARVKWRSSAAATKCSSCRSSTIHLPGR